MEDRPYKSMLVYPDIHQRIKMRATKEGIAMLDLVEKMLDEYEKKFKEED